MNARRIGSIQGEKKDPTPAKAETRTSRFNQEF